MHVRFTTVLLGAATAAGTLGCAGPEAAVISVRQQLEQVPLGATKDAVRFVLGFPARESADARNWWYLAPWPPLPRPEKAGYSLLCQFDQKQVLVLREWLAVTHTKKDLVLLQYEAVWSPEAESGPEEFTETLREKLAELAQATESYGFDRQPASFQLRMGDRLLITMERWASEQSQLVRINGRVSAPAQPQVLRAIEVARGVRRFSIELLFEPPPVTSPAAQTQPAR